MREMAVRILSTMTLSILDTALPKASNTTPCSRELCMNSSRSSGNSFDGFVKKDPTKKVSRRTSTNILKRADRMTQISCLYETPKVVIGSQVKI